jgi:hypothetical protein
MLLQLLDDVGGTGELVRATGGVQLLPLALDPRPSSRPTTAVYETPPGAHPHVRVGVRTVNATTGLMDFSIHVDRAAIPSGPAGCADGAPAGAPLVTSFRIDGGAGTPVFVEAAPSWRCRGSQLGTP